MNRLVYWFGVVSVVWALLVAPTAKAQGTYTARSCNYSDVNAVINGPTHIAINGDTIIVPPGTCAWTSTLTISVGITLQGAGAESSTSWNGTSNSTTGTDQTIFTDAEAGKATIILNTSSSNPEMRITGIAFIQNSSSSVVTGMISLGGTGTNIRIDHCHFYSYVSGTKPIVVNGSVMGVADHNFFDHLGGIITFDVAFYNGKGWNGVSDPEGYGDGSFADRDNFGTRKFFYVEDSYFNNGGMSDCVAGGRGVIRYSTGVNSQGAYSHGLSSGANRGCRAEELYMINMSYPSGHTGALGHPNSGTMLAWGNTTSGVGNIVAMQMERILADEGRDSEEIPSAPNGWGYCGTKHSTGTATTTSGSTTVTGTGFSTSWPVPFNMIIPGAQCSGVYGDRGNVCEVVSVQNSTSVTLAATAAASVSGADYTIGSPWDGGADATGYPCLDSPGRGQGDLLNGLNFPGRADGTTQRWPNEVLSPIYVWDNTYTAPGASGQGIAVDNTGTLAANRDFYQQCGAYGQSGTCNGSVGVGQGLYSAIPSTCTAGSDPKTGAVAPGVGYWATDQNTLYVCTATNTWTAYYTPYTYPHPLTSGTTTTNVNPPTGLTATVN